MKKLLIIDGEYFAHRCIFGMQKYDSNNGIEITLDTPQEQQQFKTQLQTSFITLMGSFIAENKRLIDNVLFLTDNHSWRKDVEPFRPYYLDNDTTTPIGYKDNRIKTREESTINWKAFFNIYSEFVEELSEKVLTIKIYGLEGDDLIQLVSNRLKDENVFSLVFCTDGDLKQCVKKNFGLFRNTKSLNCPDGEFVIATSLYTEIFSKNLKESLISGPNDFLKLFTMQLGTNNSIERVLGKGIEIPNQWEMVLEKTVCGDKKDNIFPIIRWLATTGTRNFSVTKKHIEKVMEKSNVKLNNNTAIDVLTNQDNLKAFLIGLKEVTKQSSIDLNRVYVHLIHNFKLILLSEKNMPENCVTEFNEKFEKMKTQLLTDIFDPECLKTFKTEQKNAGNQLLNDSISDDMISNIMGKK